MQVSSSQSATVGAGLEDPFGAVSKTKKVFQLLIYYHHIPSVTSNNVSFAFALSKAKCCCVLLYSQTSIYCLLIHCGALHYYFP